MTEDFVIKYFWSAVGYGLMSIPVFFPVARHVAAHPLGEKSSNEHHEVASRTESEFSAMYGPDSQLTFPIAVC